MWRAMGATSLSLEVDFSELYRHFMEMHPLQGEFVCGAQHWSLIDTCVGKETLLLLPGFLGEAQTSFLYIRALETHFRVISLCFPPSVSRVDTLCDGLSALMDELGIYQTTVLGGSSGGFVAQAFVRRHPSRVNCLILTHTGLPTLERARIARAYLRLLKILPYGLLHQLALASVWWNFPLLTASHVFWRAHFREILQHQDREALCNRFALMEDFHSCYRFHCEDLTGWLGRVLIMEMQRDHLTTPAERAAMRGLYPNASVQVLSETAHYDSVEHPEEQIQVIMEFLLNS